MEIKASVHVATTSERDLLHRIALKISSWTEAVYVITYVRRYVLNLQARVQSRGPTPIERRPCHHDYLMSTELSSATITLYKYLQTQMFPTELRAVEPGQPVPRKSRIFSLNPIIDPDTKVLCVGGRLQHSDLPYERQHPIILGAHPLVTKFIRHVHIQCLH
ncbi:uncharacterized protein [Neodiprion pinetum]|uniref:uncharacterized protein n=1 Tax=Neodiprion pinetum TaxID=441929 RepID=UPI003719CC8F